MHIVYCKCDLTHCLIWVIVVSAEHFIFAAIAVTGPVTSWS